jgi:single-stranded DNA-binding protein
MILALVTGTLFRTAESRVSKNGKPSVASTIRVRDGEGSQFVRIAAFSESAQAELLRLADGDCLSVQGPLTVGTYTAADGSTKVSFSLVANCVLPLRQPPKERKPAAAPDTRTRQARCEGKWQSERDGPNDDIGFGGDA